MYRVNASAILQEGFCIPEWKRFDTADLALAEKWAASSLRVSTVSAMEDPLHIGYCQSLGSNGLFVQQLVGPFIISAQEFVHVYWHKAFGSHCGTITKALSLMVDSAGQPIDTPPLHPHHAFIQPRMASPTFTPQPSDCILFGTHCPGAPNFVSWGEDNLCPSENKQWECMGKSISPRLSRSPLSVEFVDDDLRSEGIPLTFWHVFVLHFTWNAVNLTSMHIASAMFTTFQPTRGIALNHVFESFSTYKNRMPFAGRLLGVSTYVHHHFVALQRTTILLGVGDMNNWCGISTNTAFLDMPVSTARTGFSDNYQLAQCMERWPQQLICEAVIHSLQGRTQLIKCHTWLFDRDAPFTMIAYYSPSTETVDHMQWYLASLSKDGDSHFTQSLSVNQVDVFDSCLSRADILHMVFLLWMEPATSEFAAAYAILTVILLALPTWQLTKGCIFLVALMMTQYLMALWLADLHECIQVDDRISTTKECHLLNGWVAPPLVLAGFFTTLVAAAVCSCSWSCSCVKVGLRGLRGSNNRRSVPLY